jgi:hypothetical protein
VKMDCRQKTTGDLFHLELVLKVHPLGTGM